MLYYYYGLLHFDLLCLSLRMLFVETPFLHSKMIELLDTSVTTDSSVYSHFITSLLLIIQVIQLLVGNAAI